MPVNMKLNYYKMYPDVIDPVFSTEESACFDIHCFLNEEGRIWKGLPEPAVTVYTMDNKKQERKCYMRENEDGDSVLCFDFDPGERALIPTGLIFNIPSNHSVRIHARSSVSLKKGLIIPNGEGIIDSDYYHQTYVMLYNGSADKVIVNHGDRLCQGEMIETYNYILEETNKLPKKRTNRSGGFGSTGVN